MSEEFKRKNVNVLIFCAQMKSSMKRFAAIAFFIVFCSDAFSQKNESFVSLIPVPVSTQTTTGSFTVKKSASIELSAGTADAKRVADFLAEKLSPAVGYAIPVRPVKLD